MDGSNSEEIKDDEEQMNQPEKDPEELETM